jgi:hypothetical protein
LFPGSVKIEQKRGHRIDVPPQLLKLGRRPGDRLRADELSQPFKLIHWTSMQGAVGEGKVSGRASGAIARRALQVFFPAAFVSLTIKRMELMRFLMKALVGWARDVVVNLCGRLVEQCWNMHAAQLLRTSPKFSRW